MAYISVTGTTENSISVRMNGLDTGYGRADRVCRWYLDGSYKGTSSLGANISSGGAYTFRSLKSGTRYEISVEITAPGWTNTVNLSTTASTSAPKVSKWSWSSSNGSASASQTSRAYSAVRDKGETGDFSYLVWNDLVDKVNELVEASGGSWRGTSLSATKMSYSDKKITATRFNSLRDNMARYHSFSSWIPSVSKGNIVYGSYFINIVSEINSWVDEL